MGEHVTPAERIIPQLFHDFRIRIDPGIIIAVTDPAQESGIPFFLSEQHDQFSKRYAKVGNRNIVCCAGKDQTIKHIIMLLQITSGQYGTV